MEKLVPAAKEPSVSGRALVRELEADIRRKRAAGISFAAIASSFRDQGYEMSVATIKSYLREARARREGAGGSPSASPENASRPVDYTLASGAPLGATPSSEPAAPSAAARAAQERLTTQNEAGADEDIAPSRGSPPPRRTSI
jgi:hypothetical protein